LTTANEHRLLVISTRRISDRLLGKSEPEQGRLFVYDVIKGEIVGQFDPVLKATGTGLVVGVGGPGVLGWLINSLCLKSTSFFSAMNSRLIDSMRVNVLRACRTVSNAIILIIPTIAVTAPTRTLKI